MPDIHPDTGQPLGFRVDTQPALSPQAVTLSGRYGSVERLDAARHRATLWDAVAGQRHIWTYMRYGPFADAAVFSDWLVSREQTRDPFYYAIVDPDGRARGLAAFMRIEPDMPRCRISQPPFSGAPLPPFSGVPVPPFRGAPLRPGPHSRSRYLPRRPTLFTVSPFRVAASPAGTGQRIP